MEIEPYLAATHSSEEKKRVSEVQPSEMIRDLGILCCDDTYERVAARIRISPSLSEASRVGTVTRKLS